MTSIYKTTHKTGTDFGNFTLPQSPKHFFKIQEKTKQTKKFGPLASCSSSFALRLVADGGGDLTLDVLFLAVDDEEQRRVHSYTPEVKRLPEREGRETQRLETVVKSETILHVLTLTSSLCVMLFRLT